MITPRGPLLAKLNVAALGTAAKETVEQSSCFIFMDENLVTYNDEIMVRVKNPLAELCVPEDGHEGPVPIVVNATDLLQILAKIPDDEVKLTVGNGELRVKGKRQTAGIACQHEVALPVDQVPRPTSWSRVGEGVAGLLQQAARTCGDDEAQFLATCVHVTPERIEACDNNRLFRVDCSTGFPTEILVPAKSLGQLDGVELVKVGVDEATAWCHFKTAGGAVVSCRSSREEYHKKLDDVLRITDGEKLTLPANLKDMVERAEVFREGGYDAKVGVHIAPGEMTITSRKDGGWYKERKSLDYRGRELNFFINPKFLVEILGRTRDVEVDDRKMKIVSDRVQFVTSLQAKEEKRDDDGDSSSEDGSDD
jgi:hypothetical protein